MKRLFREDQTGSFILSAGWIFADMLLAVAMLFLVAGTVSIPKPPIPATPTPTPTAGITATPNLRVLERNYCRIILSLDDLPSFMNNLSSAINQLEPKIIQQKFLQGRHVDIAIAFGGASDGNEDRGAQVAGQVYSVLKDLGNKGTVFKGTSYYDSLFTRLETPITVVIDFYRWFDQDKLMVPLIRSITLCDGFYCKK